MESMSLGVWQWWAKDIFVFLSSFISSDALAAQTVLKNLTQQLFMFPFSFSVSSAIYVGNYIGKGNELLARYYAKLSIILAASWSLFIFAFMIIFRHQMIGIFNLSDN